MIVSRTNEQVGIYAQQNQALGDAESREKAAQVTATTTTAGRIIAASLVVEGEPQELCSLIDVDNVVSSDGGSLSGRTTTTVATSITSGSTTAVAIHRFVNPYYQHLLDVEPSTLTSAVDDDRAPAKVSARDNRLAVAKHAFPFLPNRSGCEFGSANVAAAELAMMPNGYRYPNAAATSALLSPPFIPPAAFLNFTLGYALPSQFCSIGGSTGASANNCTELLSAVNTSLPQQDDSPISVCGEQQQQQRRQPTPQNTTAFEQPLPSAFTSSVIVQCKSSLPQHQPSALGGQPSESSPTPPFTINRDGAIGDHQNPLVFNQHSDYATSNNSNFSANALAERFAGSGKPNSSPKAFRLLSTSVEKRNARERTRVHTVNQAFHVLKQRLPAIRANTKRVSKLKILRAAIGYIYSLSDMLLAAPAADDENSNVQSQDVGSTRSKKQENTPLVRERGDEVLQSDGAASSNGQQATVLMNTSDGSSTETVNSWLKHLTSCSTAAAQLFTNGTHHQYGAAAAAATSSASSLLLNASNWIAFSGADRCDTTLISGNGGGCHPYSSKVIANGSGNELQQQTSLSVGRAVTDSFVTSATAATSILPANFSLASQMMRPT